jgi:hypothetical protein
MPLGWHISVYRQRNDGSAPAEFKSAEGALLAVWQTGIGGLQWIDDLVNQKQAISLGGDGYPYRYTAIAKYIIPRIRDDQPPQAKPFWTFDKGDIITPRWHGKTTKDAGAMDACHPDEWLLIEA